MQRKKQQSTVRNNRNRPAETTIVAAAIQLKPQQSVEANLRNAQTLLLEAADAGAQLAVLPENFAYWGRSDVAAIGRVESGSQGPVRSFLAEQAKQLGLWLVGGSVPVSVTWSKPFARSFLIDPDGNAVGYYDKIHLFDATIQSEDRVKAYRESDDFSPGQKLATVQTNLCSLGLSVCYDLRFAELYQQLANAGAQIVVVPAAFTEATGRDHWQLLLRARAVENQTFMIGANLVDRGNGKRSLWGGSAIIDPWGQVLACLQDAAGVAVAEIDLTLIEQLKNKMPVHRHRRVCFSEGASIANAVQPALFNPPAV